MTPKTLYKKFLSTYGIQGWWPADSGFEVCVGAILAQNTSWKNAEKAIERLNAEKALSIEKIAGMQKTKLAKLIRSAGYYNQKAGYLKKFCTRLLENHDGILERMLSKKIPELRSELLSLHGIGPETADSIILYAANKPVFVIDAYTKRLNQRLPLNKKLKTYGELQNYFHSELPENAKLYNEFHALIVKHAKEYCRKKPECKECFLKSFCAFAKTPSI